MARIKDRGQAAAGSGLNDDIGEEKRLAMYRIQVVIREAEQRAFDLFLQNLVKGTSHLSLGQEAVAAGFAGAMQKGDLSFCTYRGHAHTLARGVPVEKVLGEYHWRPPADRLRRRLARTVQGRQGRLGLLLRRWHHQYRRFS
jgi:TPP-dependent pyruvate/acetoin dehydrogenase alpha subunit